MPLVVATGLMLAGEDISSSARLFVKIDAIICSIIIIGCLIWFIVDPITDVMQNWVTKRNRAKQTVIPCEDDDEEDGEEDTTLQATESVQPLKDIDDEVELFKQSHFLNYILQKLSLWRIFLPLFLLAILYFFGLPCA